MTVESSPRPPGRGAKVRAAVLASAVDELAAKGYAGFTVESVAARAGVHKTTVYRRWPEPDALITDALTEGVAADVPIPDTGGVEGDLHALARGLAAWLESPFGGAVITTVIGHPGRIDAVEDIKRHVFADRILRATPVVTRAVERGDLPAGTDPAKVFTALSAPLYLRRLVIAGPLDAEAVNDAVRVVLAAGRAGALT